MNILKKLWTLLIRFKEWVKDGEDDYAPRWLKIKCVFYLGIVCIIADLFGLI